MICGLFGCVVFRIPGYMHIIDCDCIAYHFVSESHYIPCACIALYRKFNFCKEYLFPLLIIYLHIFQSYLFKGVVSSKKIILYTTLVDIDIKGFIITVTSLWTRWRLKSAAPRFLLNRCSCADQENVKKSFASLAFVRVIHRWIPRTKGQKRWQYCHLMTSSS